MTDVLSASLFVVPNMTITIKYLASLAETLGKSKDTIQLKTPSTVGEIWQHLNPNVDYPTNTICAINFVYAKPQDNVVDGDEIAFFPPVTGG